MMRKQNLFVIGLDDLRLQQLKQLPQAQHCAFHPLLGIDAIRDPARCDMPELIHDAVDTLVGFKGTVDGIASLCDFPASVLVPILAARFALPSPGLEAVLICEHRYWSRREQAAAVRDQVPRFQAFDPLADHLSEQIGLAPPYWVKSFESFRADRSFPIHRPPDLSAALAAIPRGEAVLSEPFRWVLRNVEVPASIAEVKESFVAEAMVSGARHTLEGYIHDGEVHGLVLSDAVRKPETSSACHADPASSPTLKIERRMHAIACAVLARIGLDNAPFTIEFLYDETTDRLWLLELHPRLSRMHGDLFEQAHGLSRLGVMVDLALGRKPTLMSEHDKPRGVGVQPSADEAPVCDHPADLAEKAIVNGSTRVAQADIEVAGSRILVVDDEEPNRVALKTTLSDAGFCVDLAQDSQQLFARLQEAKPDLILLDIRLPGDDGFTLCERLQADPNTVDIPVIFVTSIHKNAASIAKGFAAGGVDFVTRPFFPEELIARVQTHLRLKMYREHLEALTRVDPLTGLLNRRAMFEQLESERRRALRTGLIYALVLADIDHFKPVNDDHGHRCGDAVLASVASILKDRMRRSEKVCRWGGEEFLLLLPATDAKGAAVLAEELRAAVAATAFSCGGQTLRITLSFGIMADSGEQPFGVCIRKADDALYAAKGAGRNRCVTHADAARSLAE